MNSHFAAADRREFFGHQHDGLGTRGMALFGSSRPIPAHDARRFGAICSGLRPPEPTTHPRIRWIFLGGLCAAAVFRTTRSLFYFGASLGASFVVTAAPWSYRWQERSEPMFRC